MVLSRPFRPLHVFLMHIKGRPDEHLVRLNRAPRGQKTHRAQVSKETVLHYRLHRLGTRVITRSCRLRWQHRRQRSA